MSDNWNSRVYQQVDRMSGLEYAEWRLLRDVVLGRDNFTCQRCDRKFRSKYKLGAHHIIPRAHGGSNDINNLITLCHPCHDYVEVYELKTFADIIGSYDFVIIVDTPASQYESEESFTRPGWHAWVYGGCRG